MSGFTLQQVFGYNSSQDSNQIIINKSDLSQTGFIPSTENDGESIFTALVVSAMNNGLNSSSRDGDETSDPNPNQQIAVSFLQTSYISRNDNNENLAPFKRDTLTVDFDLPLPSSINPNSY